MMLQPTCHLKEVAPQMNWGVVEIIPVDASTPGILASVSSIIAKAKQGGKGCRFLLNKRAASYNSRNARIQMADEKSGVFIAYYGSVKCQR